MMVGIARFGSGSTGDMCRADRTYYRRFFCARPATFPVVEQGQAASTHSAHQSKMVGSPILFRRVRRLFVVSGEGPEFQGDHLSRLIWVG